MYQSGVAVPFGLLNQPWLSCHGVVYVLAFLSFGRCDVCLFEWFGNGIVSVMGLCRSAALRPVFSVHLYSYSNFLLVHILSSESN